ncbi:4-hydroxybenzoate polyprenyltransferase [Streptomyces zhaozhouensis]|uniref:4-hydroxybenzoate polyprenyltransferase n=1 Tax=Streptomyces zhaozhouensis TaxID=1300267 RepID=A0A286E9K8_9ACTN|nr:UbiA family prenyltransferase [Streptomyces zhaozhouensis]SOD67615.1 4-hydroxybenzoate polyprenyltransferase [Streptomyces zhaozhouensis]
MTLLVENVRVLYGFSRGTQATLSVAQPMLGLLLAGGTSPGRMVLVGLAAFAAYFAVFAVNDLIDWNIDQQRFANLREFDGYDIDSAGVRHPLAQGRLSLPVAASWVASLGAVSLVLAAMISWVCVVLFVAAGVLEALYCKLARVTPYKTLLTGVMVALGGCVGWFAVTDAVNDPLLWLFALWLAAWEIGGRNIVNDLADVDEDKHLGVRTVPTVYGRRRSGVVSAVGLLVTFAASVGMVLEALPVVGLLGAAGTLAAGGYALVWPALRLLRCSEPPTALDVFNRASLYPLVVLGFALLGLPVHALTGL